MVPHGGAETHSSNGNNFFLSLICFLINRDQKTSTQRKHRAAVLSNERAPPCLSSDLGSSLVQRLDVEEVGTSSEACFLALFNLTMCSDIHIKFNKMGDL